MEYLSKVIEYLQNDKKLSTRIFIGVFVLTLASAVYFYSQVERTKKLLTNPSAATKEQVKGVVDRVARLIDVPKNEEPTVATISDISKLKDQPFFTKAENGDKVIIYSQIGRAILYRPSIDKIIEVAPVTKDDKSFSPAAQQASFKGIRVAIYNGSGKAGLAGSTETKIKAKYPDITIVTKENAVKSDYAENIVIDIKGGKTGQVQALAGLIGGKVGSLPDGELKPDADILIIVAK